MTFRVTYAGHPGNYYVQPEPAEFIAECPVTGTDADMQTSDGIWPGERVFAYCSGCGGEHDVGVPDEGPDPYDAWRDARDEARWDDA